MVVDRFNGGMEKCKQSKLWELKRDFWEPFERIKPRMNVFTISKVKAHCDHNSVVPEEHRKCNNMADRYAGQAVVEVTTGDESRVRRMDRQTRLTQERMIQAIFLLPRRARHPEDVTSEPAIPYARAPRIAQAKALEYDVTRRGPYLECQRCGQFWLSKRVDILADLGQWSGQHAYGTPARDRP